jgi:hypothetical protein
MRISQSSQTLLMEITEFAATERLAMERLGMAETGKVAQTDKAAPTET